METNISDLQSRMPGADTAVAVQQASSMGAEEQRAIAQVQGAMTIAQRFPRDENKALAKILETCKVVEFAEEAEFAYKRGGSLVTGATIRLLEECARHWKNLEFSVAEMVRGEKESLCQTYAVDLENNTWSRSQFVVPHRRDVSEGAKDLKSDRDIYEMVANMGSRRVRSNLERLIPSYVVDAALKTCKETLKKRDQLKPLAERIRSQVESFGRLGVTETMLAKWLKRPVSEMLENDYQALRTIGRGIKEGLTRIDEHFEAATVADGMANKRTMGGAGGAKTAGSAGNSDSGGGRPAADPKPEPATGGGVASGDAGSGAVAPDVPSTGSAAASAGGGARTDSGTAGGSEPTKASLLVAVADAKTVNAVNNIGNLLKSASLTKDEMKELRIASAKRVQAIQQEERAKNNQGGTQQPATPQQSTPQQGDLSVPME